MMTCGKEKGQLDALWEEKNSKFLGTFPSHNASFWKSTIYLMDTTQLHLQVWFNFHLQFIFKQSFL